GGAKAEDVDQVYVGYDESGIRTGFAIPGAEPGFQDLIHLIFGYDAADGEVLGMRVLENKETPGLGDKIVKDSTFVSEFEGAEAPLEGVKPGAGTDAANEIDMITGATISSETVVEIINHRIEELDPMLERWTSEEGP
ncbi:MAG: FMN-binding protein, partial [Gemmatimonadota bacterium]|nr:FMN-binding protein [Gemmatimonadota bacterium]